MSAMPLPSRRFDPGLCASAPPCRAISSISASSIQIACAPLNRGPSSPIRSRCAVSVMPYCCSAAARCTANSARWVCTGRPNSHARSRQPRMNSSEQCSGIVGAIPSRIWSLGIRPRPARPRGSAPGSCRPRPSASPPPPAAVPAETHPAAPESPDRNSGPRSSARSPPASRHPHTPAPHRASASTLGTGSIADRS